MRTTGPVRRDELERLYRRYNHRRCVHPDPVELLYGYEEEGDREIAGLVASSLAYGRAGGILRAAGALLAAMGRPRAFLERTRPVAIRRRFRGFRYRFTRGEEVGRLLLRARALLAEYGTLGECFAAGMEEGEETVLAALRRFSRLLRRAGGVETLVPSPEGTSPLKRLCLYARWMVRRDRVDPGGWRGVSPARLIVPLDTHLHRAALALGLTRRRTRDMRTALETTAALRRLRPDDPVRYDFALTRPGILGRAGREAV